MRLTDAAIRAAKPSERPQKLFDGDGLFLLLKPVTKAKGGKWWRLKYFFGGREKSISLGTYPDTSLARARQKRDQARRDIEAGVDPSAERRAEKQNRGNTFAHVAVSFIEDQRAKLSPETISNIENRLNALSRHIRAAPIDQIKPFELLTDLKKLTARGRHDTAKRTRADCSRVFRHAIAHFNMPGLRDITYDIRGAITGTRTQHLPALTQPLQVGELLRDMWAYNGCHPVTHIALKLTPYVFVRPGELRTAEWGELELDGDAPTWRIPASKMKMRRPHLVPLSRQAVELLRQVDAYTGDRRYVFSITERPMSENTINMALRMVGGEGKYRNKQTAHGFRSIASTLLNEMNVAPDLIELQLAHVEQNKSRAAYMRADHLPGRREMMQKWADYLDELRAAVPSK